MKQLITVDGEDVLVREDVAKKHRGIIWAMLSLLAILVIAVAAMLIGSGVIALDDTQRENPQPVKQEQP